MEVSSWYTPQVGNQWHHLWHWQKSIRNWHNDYWQLRYICCYYYWWHWILWLGWEDSISGYLNSLIPLECFLTIESHANLQEIYMVLCKSVHDIRVKLATNDTIFGIEENQSVIDTTIAENRTTSAVTTIDDIEFWDWAGRTRFHSLRYCNDISKWPMLQIAVEKALRKSCHDNMVSTEFFEGITTSKLQFMGFVSQHTKEGYLSSFHPISFVLLRADVYSSSTVVVCTLTTRNHIQSNMQDRLLQLVQIYQYQAHKIKFLMIILNDMLVLI